VQVLPINLANSAISPFAGGNQATINSLSYLGGGATPFQGTNFQGTGPDAINSVVVANEGGSNFIYVAGSLTDATGRTDAFVAKLTDGATNVVWAEALLPAASPGPGPDRATGLAVDANGVYVAGFVADSAATPQTDGFVVQLNAGSGAGIASATLTSASFAAVATDSSGNVYVAGSVGDTTNPGQVDVGFVQSTSDLQTINFASAFAFSLGGAAANSAVVTGSGLIVDSVGNAYFGGTLGVVGDPNNNVFAFAGQLDASGSTINWNFYLDNITPGPGGIITALGFDPSGNVGFTGSLNDNTTTAAPTLLNQDLAIGHANPGTGNLVGGVFYYWYVDDRSGNPDRVGDWSGNGLVALPDGSTIVTGATYDPAAGTGIGDPASLPSKGIDVHMTHFGAGDNSTTQNGDGDPENIFGGSGTDVGMAIALDPNSSASPYNVYVVGTTSSTDLLTTAGVVQPTFAGGVTGFVGQASVV
jgi:hypothetical protein